MRVRAIGSGRCGTVAWEGAGAGTVWVVMDGAQPDDETGFHVTKLEALDEEAAAVLAEARLRELAQPTDTMTLAELRAVAERLRRQG